MPIQIQRLHKDIPMLAVGNTIQLIGALYNGPECTFLVPFPTEEAGLLDGELRILAMNSTEFAEFLDQSDKLDIEATNKAILRKSQRMIDQGISWKVFRRDGYRCRYCGNDNTPLTVDHCKPYEDEGPTVEANLVACCRHCNRLKGKMPYEHWLISRDYKERSKKLTPEVRLINYGLLAKMHKLPKIQTTRSR